MVYPPREDSYLLASVIKKYLKNKSKDIKILDMGSGSGIQAKTCINSGFKNVLAVDIDPEAIKHLKNQKLKVKQSNLFSEIFKRGLTYKRKLVPLRFDLIVSNPPYLPEHRYDKKMDTTAGKYGYELILKFLKQAKSHLNKDGEILLLFSNLSKPNIIKQNARKLSYSYKKLSSKKLFFEILYIYRFRL